MDDKQREDRLAGFVDRLLNDEHPPVDDDRELRDLEEASRELWQAFGRGKPDDLTSQRIKRDVMSEYRRQFPQEEKSSRAEQSSSPPSLGRLLRRPDVQRMMAAAAMLVLVGAALLLGALPSTGAADPEMGGALPFIGGILIVVAIGGAVWWIVQRSE